MKSIEDIANVPEIENENIDDMLADLDVGDYKIRID